MPSRAGAGAKLRQASVAVRLLAFTFVVAALVIPSFVSSPSP